MANSHNDLTYDNAGNTTEDERAYEYDYENRIVRITDVNDANVAEFAYDALGRRIKKVDSVAGTTIKAKVVEMVQADPARLDLSLRKKNLGLNEITIQSQDARDSTPPHYYWVIAARVRDQILRSLNLANMRLVFRVFSLEIRDVI